MAGARGRLVSGLVTAAAVAACGRGAEPPAQAESAARAEILSPMDGDSVSLPATLRLAASGITIAAATGVREEGVAHHHLLLNVDHSPDNEPIPAGNGYFHIGSGASEWILDSLPAGIHRIIARLAWGDHVPIAGAATDTITIVVRPGPGG